MAASALVSRGEPEIRWTSRPRDAHAVALVLHGGAEASDHENRWLDHAVLRMVPFARALAREGGDALAVARLRFGLRGWNAPDEAPVADAHWALDSLRAAYPDRPIGVVGHSMGGRVALRLAAEPDVVAVCTLAAWVEGTDEAQGGPGTSALLVHGSADRITPPRGSVLMARWLAERGVEAEFLEVPDENHALLRHPVRAHRTVARWVTERLLAPSAAGPTS